MKNGYLEFDKSITVGQAFDGYKYFKSKKWISYKTDQGRRVVEFSGAVDMGNPDNQLTILSTEKPSTIETKVQFLINGDNTYSVADVNMAGTMQDGSVKDGNVLGSRANVMEAIFANRSFTNLAIFR